MSIITAFVTTQINCLFWWQVYELMGSRWIDQGTAFCLGSFQNETQEAFIIARAESNFNEIILSTAIRGNDVYQRQQGVLFKAWCLVPFLVARICS